MEDDIPCGGSNVQPKDNWLAVVARKGLSGRRLRLSTTLIPSGNSWSAMAWLTMTGPFLRSVIEQGIEQDDLFRSPLGSEYWN